MGDQAWRDEARKLSDLVAAADPSGSTRVPNVMLLALLGLYLEQADQTTLVDATPPRLLPLERGWYTQWNGGRRKGLAHYINGSFAGCGLYVPTDPSDWHPTDSLYRRCSRCERKAAKYANGLRGAAR